MRARFARTLRLHMRDADLYTHPGTHVWNEDDALTAEKFLSIIRDNLQLSDDEIVVTLATHNPTLQEDDIHRTGNVSRLFRMSSRLLMPEGMSTPCTSMGRERKQA